MSSEAKRYHPDYIKRWHNNYSKAMFWASFTYDHKGPCYIYYPKTSEQKTKNQEEINRLNKEEIIAEAREAFDAQEREKERK